jgi:hypothetical protein
VVEWSEFLATDPEVPVRILALPDFLRSSESGTGSTEPRENYFRVASVRERSTPTERTPHVGEVSAKFGG